MRMMSRFTLAPLLGLVLAPMTASAQTFYVGSDLSYVNEMIDCGAVYRNDGVETDPYDLFAERGTNLVRLRLWHDPDWTEYSTLEDVERAMAASKAAGMPVLLDFHYSDDWADPGDQIIPAAWANLDDEALAEAVFTYTRDTLVSLHEKGLSPTMVQVGNETNTEVMLPAPVEEDTEIDWERNVLLLNAGILGVEEAARLTGHRPDIMLHIAQPENVEPWFDAAFDAGILDFEVIGLSYYPKWSSRDLEGLGQTISRLRNKYQKEVIVVETSYPWTLEGQDAAGNILGEDSLIPAYPATLDGQRAYMIDLTQRVMETGGSGVVYWEPAWVSTSCETRWGKGSHWENNTFFDYEATNAHQGFDWITADYRQPATVTFEMDGEAGGPTLYLWSSVFHGRDFTVPLTPDDQGRYAYIVSVPADEPIQYQLYGQSDLSDPLIDGGSAGLPSLTATGDRVVTIPPTE